MSLSDSFRVTSDHFRALRWKTDILITPAGLEKLKAVPLLQKYVSVLLKYESSANSSIGNYLLKNFCKTGEMPNPPTGKDYSLLVKEFLKYRLLDVAAAIHEVGNRSEFVARGDVPQGLLHRISPKLSDWVLLLRRAMKSMNESDSSPQSHAVSVPTNDKTNRCLRYLCQRWDASCANKIMLNFCVAALHLSYLLEGKMEWPSDVNVIEKWFEGLEVDPNLRAVLHNAEGIQLPLFLACAISPLCLMVPSPIYEKNVGKEVLFNTWQRLDSHTPPVMAAVESQLWDVLLKTVNSPESLPTLLREVVLGIDIKALENVEPTERYFLRTGPLAIIAPNTADQAHTPRIVLPKTSSVLPSSYLLAGHSNQTFDFSKFPSNDDASDVPAASSAIVSLRNAIHPAESRPRSDLTQASDHAHPEDMVVDEGPEQPTSVGDMQKDNGHDIPPASPSHVSGVDKPAGSSDHNVPTGAGSGGDTVDVHADDQAFSPEEGVMENEGFAKEDDGRPEPRIDETMALPRTVNLDATPNTDVPMDTEDVQGGAVDIASVLNSAAVNNAGSDVEEVITVRATRSKSQRLAARRDTTRASSPMRGQKKRKLVETVVARRKHTKRAKSSKPEVGPRSYFEEVEDNGIMKFVLVHDLTKDLAESEVPPLEKVSGIAKSAGNTYILHGPHNSYSYTPRFHWHAEHELFVRLYTANTKYYEHGAPSWQTNPDKSCIHILTHDQMSAMTASDMQKILAKKHIYVLPKDPNPNRVSFDEAALSSLALLDKSIVFHDHSKPNEFNSGSRHTRGTLYDLLLSHRAGDKGTILNALDLPLLGGSPFPSTFSSDFVAFTTTVDMPSCGRDTLFPLQTVRWGLAATANAHHLWHIDCDGLATVIEPECGAKWWVLARPRSPSDMASVSLFLHDFELDKANDDKWELEGVLVTAGSKLIMRPNTPHFVYTPFSSTCRGGHFYATASIRSSVFGIYHHFCASGLVTNAQHTKDARLLLSRLVIFWHYYCVVRKRRMHPGMQLEAHVPAVGTFDGLIDLLMVCTVMEFGHILDPGAYSSANPPDGKDVVRTIHARGYARELVKWWDASFILVGQDGSRETAQNIFQRLFTYHARAIVAYKRQAELQNIQGENEDCTSVEIARWISRLHGETLQTISDFPSDWKLLNFDWTWETYEVQSITSQFQPLDKVGIFELGTLELDAALVDACREELTRLRGNDGDGEDDSSDTSASEDE